ncbi:MAG TPA: hypothetical protein VGN52_10355 [Burkholderiales bacterium]|jgi:hypothetical protein
MLSSIKKILTQEIGPRQKPATAPEYIFLLDLERKKEYLLDLRAILRTPGSRRALPRLHRLETTVTRNDQRVRIPHEAMVELVRELVSVERRIPEVSPLRELLEAVPGLAKSIRVDPTPTSVLMGAHEEVPGELNTREMNQAARQLGEALAQPLPLPQTEAGKDKPARKRIVAAPAGERKDTAGATSPGVMVMETTNPTEPIFGSTVMSAAEQQRFLQESGAQLEAAVLRTTDLADGDLAAYFDLCIMSGEHEKVIDSLLPRVAEHPSAWAWTRLLAAAEAAKKLEFEVWCSNFKAWAARTHPQLLPDMLTQDKGELRFGVRRTALHDLERQELKRA